MVCLPLTSVGFVKMTLLRIIFQNEIHLKRAFTLLTWFKNHRNAQNKCQCFGIRSRRLPTTQYIYLTCSYLSNCTYLTKCKITQILSVHSYVGRATEGTNKDWASRQISLSQGFKTDYSLRGISLRVGTLCFQCFLWISGENQLSVLGSLFLNCMLWSMES